MADRFAVLSGIRAFWKLFLVAGAIALAFSLGSILITRGAPTGSTTYFCASYYTGGLRHVYRDGQCTAREQQIAMTTFDGAGLDDAYINEGQPDSITSPMIVDGQVMNGDLAGNSVTTDKILDGAITTDDLGAGSVGSDEVIDNSLTADDLGTDSVNGDEIASGAVNTGELAGNSVTTGKILDGTIGSGDLSSNSVTSEKILNNTIIQNDLSAGAQDWIDGQTLQGYEIVQRVLSIDPNTGVSANIVCPQGKRVTGGGMESSSNAVVFTESFPRSSAEWLATAINSTTNTQTMTIYAICVGS